MHAACADWRALGRDKCDRLRSGQGAVPLRVTLVRLVRRPSALHRRGGLAHGPLLPRLANLEFLYRHIVNDLRDRYRCIAVDYLGFGLSERPGDFGYTIAEHTAVLGELIDHLRLDDFVVMGQDWGGPIGLGAATARAERVRGIVLGNNVFWPVEAMLNRAFSVVMSSRPMQRRILEQNFLIERFLLGELGRELTETEADHYRAVQPTPAARRGLAVMPKQIRAARPLLERLSRDVPAKLGDKPALLVELPQARHFIQEHAPDAIATAIASRFPPR